MTESSHHEDQASFSQGEEGGHFRLDTVGVVMVRGQGLASSHPHAGSNITWPALSPFTQGYVEAMLTPDPYRLPGLAWRSGCPACVASKFTCDEHHRRGVGFSDLAPETLARIIADCEARLRHRPSQGETNPYFGITPHRQLLNSGARFWTDRQAGLCKNFPPLTVQLGDDGKVRFA